MESSLVDDQVKKIFLEVFPELNESSFDWNKDQNDYENWDSFAHLKIVSQIEEKFNIKLEIDDIVYIRNATGFLKIIKNKINSNEINS